MDTLLIENGTIVTVNENRDVLENGYITIQEDLIAAVESGSAPEPLRAQADDIIDASGFAVMPGLVNAHNHLHESFIRGLSDDRNLMDWLYDIAFPIYTHMRDRDVYLATMVGIIENIRGGATAVTNCLEANVHPSNADASCQAALEFGIRYKHARGWADRNWPDPLREEPERIFAEVGRLVEEWHGKANGRIRVDFEPASNFGCSGGTILRCAELAQEWGIGVHMHVAESEEELTLHVEETGKRCVQWLYDLGVLGPSFQLAHSVWVDDEEIELLAQSGATVIHNPVSNMYLAAGTAPIPQMRREGVSVALGTDGQACNNGQEMMDVLKWTFNLHKVTTRDAMVLTSEDVIEMACQGGSLAFGVPEQIGSLEVGKKADLILVDMSNSRMMPPLSVPSALVNYTRSTDVDTVIVDGRLLMQGRKILVLDEESVLEETRAVRNALLERAGFR